MDEKVDKQAKALAGQLRQEREVRGWSLNDLARRSEVSKAAISKIERNEASPTATVLVRLAGAFDMTLAELITRAENSSLRLVKQSAQPLWQDPATGYTRRQIFIHSDHPIEIAEIEMPPGQSVEFPASSYVRIRQCIAVKMGSLSVCEGPQKWNLQSGDCLGLGPAADVKISNQSDEICKYQVIVVRQ